jgi:hypothetical protein
VSISNAIRHRDWYYTSRTRARALYQRSIPSTTTTGEGGVHHLGSIQVGVFMSINFFSCRVVVLFFPQRSKIGTCRSCGRPADIIYSRPTLSQAKKNQFFIDSSSSAITLVWLAIDIHRVYRPCSPLVYTVSDGESV